MPIVQQHEMNIDAPPCNNQHVILVVTRTGPNAAQAPASAAVYVKLLTTKTTTMLTNTMQTKIMYTRQDAELVHK